MSLAARLAELAAEHNFLAAGIAPIPDPDYPELQHFEPWIDRGAAGDMHYLARRDQAQRLLRSSLRIAVPWARSIIVCAAGYRADGPTSLDPASPGAAWIARYAWSSHAGAPTDYHDILLGRLKTLAARLALNQTRCYVDTGPLVERVYARYAGIGWIGKNTCVLNQRHGSWMLLGVILTADELPPDQPLQLPPDRCGSCTRCIDACPTQALTPYQMQADRCIAYLTIEKRGSIDPALRPLLGRQVFGCDICQEVCPWNNLATRRGPAPIDPELAPRPELINPALAWLGDLDAAAFRTHFRHSPLQRTKLTGLLRNVALAMGNSGLSSFLPRLEQWATCADPVLAESATWAIHQLHALAESTKPNLS